ncbi:DNA-3-methyladenine glycosylase I [Virgibacillus salexigens]|uniref:DNA-3-methyladenine glycosylase I n=1 Tax=Virgibacillus massiliensis TaxID=1462526 RepID=A0A024QFN3_9BACI|nr:MULTISPECIES: DNA-3-methyladenine glycosylase I [Virgibacillus]MYL43272.1 DNA-3-methyladenine glycosylase I [Virgibacillus massiliensis]CDQ41032.1 DNA-3-methyladenine glycosylase 1 [Virgibacillus massiliensis]
MKQRCHWVTNDPIYIEYHDNEWGRAVYDDQKLFEMLSLEGAQAGLSWITVLKRRENYRKAFEQFDPAAVSGFSESKINELAANEGIIRHRGKIASVVTNAQAFLQIQQEFGSFSRYIWNFVDGKPIVNNWQSHEEVPAYTKESENMSKDLKRRGFRFVGPTICYAFMQATGMVNDHIQGCFLYNGDI